jgi:hypothetical protein
MTNTKLNYKVPEIGMGATVRLWSDRHAYTIIDVSKSGKLITIQQDHVIRTDNNGMSESRIYQYSSDPQGHIDHASLRKDNHWRLKGRKTLVHVGSRNEYYDYSF